MIIQIEDMIKLDMCSIMSEIWQNISEKLRVHVIGLYKLRKSDM